jgi:hypothetical protein
MWAKVIDGAVVAYPYGPSDLRRDNPNTSFANAPSLEALADWNVVPVEPRNPPAHDPVTQDCVRVNPTRENGVWVETWEVRTASAEDVATRKGEQRAGMELSFAQMLIGLVAEGWITEAEGEAWLVGTVPAAASALIATLPQGQRFAAKARAVRPSVVQRADPLVAALAAAEGKTEDQLDTFFLTYAQV